MWRSLSNCCEFQVTVTRTVEPSFVTATMRALRSGLGAARASGLSTSASSTHQGCMRGRSGSSSGGISYRTCGTCSIGGPRYPPAVPAELFANLTIAPLRCERFIWGENCMSRAGCPRECKHDESATARGWSVRAGYSLSRPPQPPPTRPCYCAPAPSPLVSRACLRAIKQHLASNALGFGVKAAFSAFKTRVVSQGER